MAFCKSPVSNSARTCICEMCLPGGVAPPRYVPGVTSTETKQFNSS